MKERMQKYIPSFSEWKLKEKLARFASAMGVKTVYSVLLLYYAYRRKDTPSWAKNIVLGTLGYLITPIDVIPDLTPVLGFTDDFGVLSYGLVTIAAFINPEVRVKARIQLHSMFDEVYEKDLMAVDQKL